MAVLGMDGNARQFRRPPVRLGWGIVCASLLWGLAPGEIVVGATERGSPTGILRELGYESVVLRRTEENHWFVFGRVNGRRRSCLVDTGWSFATVSTNASARLSPARVIERLDLGRVTLTNEPVLVQDMRVNGRPTPYDVVLGCDLLIRHHAILDCANNRLHLRRTAPTLSETRELEQRLRNAGWVAIELQRHQPAAFTCMAKINEQPLKLLVDSAAVWSCLDVKSAAALNLRLTRSPNRIRGAGAAGTREMAVVDLQRVQLGDLTLRPLSMAVFDLRDWGLGPDGRVLDNVAGILGGADLTRAGALIDCGRATLWLRAR